MDLVHRAAGLYRPFLWNSTYALYSFRNEKMNAIFKMDEMRSNAFLCSHWDHLYLSQSFYNINRLVDNGIMKTKLNYKLQNNVFSRSVSWNFNSLNAYQINHSGKKMCVLQPEIIVAMTKYSSCLKGKPLTYQLALAHVCCYVCIRIAHLHWIYLIYWSNKRAIMYKSFMTIGYLSKRNYICIMDSNNKTISTYLFILFFLVLPCFLFQLMSSKTVQ